MRKLCFFASAACLFTAVASTASAQPKVEEVVLGPASGQSYSSVVPHLRKTGLHVAIQVTKGSRFAMRVDGVDGPIFDQLNTFAFSKDGTRHGYIVRVDDGFIVVIDGKEVARAPATPTGQPQFRNPGFSPGGKHSYDQKERPDEFPHCWVIDGKPGEYCGGVEPPVFSPDETRYFHKASKPDGRTGMLIVDGKESGFPGQDPQFSPDSKNVITIAHSPTESALVINGRPGSRAKRIHSAHMSTGGINLLILDTGREGGSTQFLGTSGKKIEGSDCSRIESVTDGEESEGFPTMQSLASSKIQKISLGAGGKRVGFLGNMPISRDTQVVIDGKATTVKGAPQLAFSPDASRSAFAAGDAHVPHPPY